MGSRSVMKRAATLQGDVVVEIFIQLNKEKTSLFAADHIRQDDLVRVVGAASCCCALSAHLGRGVRMLRWKQREA
jgi:hypothetical protein